MGLFGSKCKFRLTSLDDCLKSARNSVSRELNKLRTKPVKYLYNAAKFTWDTNWDNLIEPIAKPIFGALGYDDQEVVATQMTCQRLREDIKTGELSRAILTAIRDNSSISKAITYTALTGFRTDIDSFYNYAKNSYYKPIPEEELQNFSINKAAVQDVLETLEGELVTIHYTSVTKLNNLDAIWSKYWLQENEPDYIFTSDELLVTPDLYPFDYVQDNTTSITVFFDNSGTPYQYPTDITSLPSTEMHYVVEYHLNIDPSITKVWIYDESLGTYPTLDLPDTSVFQTDFVPLPVIPLRENTVSINEDTSTNKYKTTKRLLATINQDLDSLITGVTKQEDSNGKLVDIDDIDKIKDIYLLFGLNLYSESQLVNEGLFDFFAALYRESVVDKTTFDAAVADDDTTDLPKNIHIFKDEPFQCTLNYNYITEEIIDADLYEVDTFYKTIEDSNIISTSSGASYDTADVVIDYQIIKGKVVRLTINGLMATYVTNTDVGPKAHFVVTEAWQEGDTLSDIQKNFIIPSSYELYDINGFNDAEIFGAETLHIIVMASDITDLDWYKTSEFLTLVNVIITTASFIYGGPAGAQTTTEFFKQLLIQLLIKFAFDFVMQKIFELTDDEDLRLALALIAAAGTAYAASGFGAKELSTAEEVLQAVNVITMAGTKYVELSLNELQNEYDTFLNDAKELQKEIEEAKDFLENDSPINPLFLIDSTIDRDETPTEFYTRTLTTAPGQLTFNQLHNYFDNALDLDNLDI